jgi:hypothetical protein
MMSSEPIKLPLDGNSILTEVLQRVNSNEKLKTMWDVVNTNAMRRMGYSDHGHIHFKIVSNIGLRILRLLKAANVEPSVTKDYGLPYEYAELIVVLGCLLHDLGMSINRKNHEEFSLFLANRMMEDLLDFLPTKERVIIVSEALHAIISHRSDGQPLTVEAGIVRVADALDMTRGRSRIPFEMGKVDIHSLSAYAIDVVEIAEGKEFPVEVMIKMNNSAGVFQVDELLKEKLKGSGLEKYVSVRAVLKEGDTEEKLLSEFVFGSKG